MGRLRLGLIFKEKIMFLIEVDTAIEIAHELHYKTKEELQPLGHHIVSVFKQLTGLIG